MSLSLHKKTVFTNANKDKVTIALFEDTYGGLSYSLFVNTERVRKLPEKRFVENELIEIATTTSTQEVKHIVLPTEYMAVNEYNLYRVLEHDPEYSSAEYYAWQAQQKEEI